MPDAPAQPPVQDVVLLAVTLHKSGHLNEAEELYQAALRRMPEHVDALHYMGVLRHQQGKSDEAVTLIRSALRVDPKYFGARINLGNVLKETGRFKEAEREYTKVLERNPNVADAHNNLGAVLRALKRPEEAIKSYREATRLNPDHADAFENLGNALKSLGQIEEALDAYRTAITIDDQHGSHLSLGRLLYSYGRIDEARDVYQKWTEVDPGNAIAQHMLVACSEGEPPDRCSEAFVKESFDAFANSFEEVLERLDYRAPELVLQAVKEEAREATRQWKVLDAGCGTGLCGEGLRPYSEQLVGIDLSPKMIEKAGVLGVYDELHEAEIVRFLNEHPDEYGLILSADTLCYFGDLGALFRAVSASLKAGGTFVFTVERQEENEDSVGYQLHPHGRYAHHEDYVRDSLKKAGLEVGDVTREVLRMEVKQPVDGLVVSAKKLG